MHLQNCIPSLQIVHTHKTKSIKWSIIQNVHCARSPTHTNQNPFHPHQSLNAWCSVAYGFGQMCTELYVDFGFALMHKYNGSTRGAGEPTQSSPSYGNSGNHIWARIPSNWNRTRRFAIQLLINLSYIPCELATIQYMKWHKRWTHKM